jgi:hypothetical protein
MIDYYETTCRHKNNNNNNRDDDVNVGILIMMQIHSQKIQRARCDGEVERMRVGVGFYWVR